MERVKRRSSLEELLGKDISEYGFYVAYGFLLSFSLLGHVSILGSYLKLAADAAMLILILAFLIQIRKFQAGELLAMLVVGAVASIVAYETGDYAFVKLLLLLVASKSMSLRKIVRFDVVIRVVLVSTVLLLYVGGLALDVQSYFEGTYRHSLGFTNPNALGMAILILCLEILYLNQMRFRWSTIAFVVVLSTFSDFYAGSRAASVVVVMAVFLSICHSVRPEILRLTFVRTVSCYSAVIFCGLMACLVYLYASGGAIAHELNHLLSNRLSNTYLLSQSYGISWFGNNLENSGLALDSTYAYLWIGLGPLVLIFFLWAFTGLMRELIRQDNIPLLIVFFCLATYGMSERLWVNVDYNVFMLAFVQLFKGSTVMR